MAGIGMLSEQQKKDFGSYVATALVAHSAYKTAKEDADRRNNALIQVQQEAAERFEQLEQRRTELMADFGDDLRNSLMDGFNSLESVVQKSIAGVENTIFQSSKALGALFEYGVNLIVDEMRDVGVVQHRIHAELAQINDALRSPMKVQVAELTEKGFYLLSRHLPDKALSTFQKVLDLDETNIMAEYQIGRIYLYGIIDETETLICPAKAILHFKNAQRYAKQELRHSSDMMSFYLEICFSLGVAYFAAAMDDKHQENEADAESNALTAIDLLAEVEKKDPEFLEATYQKARCMKLMGLSDHKTVLRKLSVENRDYFLKMSMDPLFSLEAAELRKESILHKEQKHVELDQLVALYKQYRAEYLECDGLPTAEYSEICCRWAKVLDEIFNGPIERYKKSAYQECLCPYCDTPVSGEIYLFREDAFLIKAKSLLEELFLKSRLLKLIINDIGDDDHGEIVKDYIRLPDRQKRHEIKEILQESERKKIQEKEELKKKKEEKKRLEQAVANEAKSKKALGSVKKSLAMLNVDGGEFLMGHVFKNTLIKTVELKIVPNLIRSLPASRVKISSFFLSATVITENQYEAAMRNNLDASEGIAKREVSWNDAITYCNKLSQLEGFEPAYYCDQDHREVYTGGSAVFWKRTANGYRLPTEAEWEYAARGGANSRGYKYAGSNATDSVAWHKGNSTGIVHPVAGKTPNELGLYDMSGNQWEWCWDWFAAYTADFKQDPIGPDSGTCRVVRGGYYGSIASACTVDYRYYCEPENISYRCGFRVARNV